MRRALFLPLVVCVSLTIAGCNKQKSADAEGIEKLRHEMEEMKARQAAATPATPVPEATLTGSVFYRTKSGETTILSASRVYLLPPRIANPTAEDVKAGHLSPDDSVEYKVVLSEGLWSFDRNNNLEIEEVEKPARRTPFQCTTDVAGKYSFPNVEPGDYYLFTTINTTKAVGFWFQKIAVPTGHTTTVDLNNSNIRVVAENVRY